MSDSLVEKLSKCNFVHCNLNYNLNCPLQLELQIESSFATCPLGIDSTKHFALHWTIFLLVIILYFVKSLCFVVQKVFPTNIDNAFKKYRGRREEKHHNMQNNLKMEGSSDGDGGVDNGDDTKDIEVFPCGRGCRCSSKSRKFNHCWCTTHPWLMHNVSRDGVHGYIKYVACQATSIKTR